MKLSRKFLNDYVDTNEIEINKLAEDMTSVGNEYDYCGKLINCTNLIIGEVLTCEPHPDSDHLHVCTVDVGKEVLDIVCGAPNCRKGLKVIVAQVGAKLPDGEIKAGKIINISSVSAVNINTHGAAYGATKAGLDSFGRSLWAEIRKHGVKVVNIRPDMTRTELYRNADFEASSDFGAALDPEDVANAVSDVLDMKEGAVITEMTLTPQFVRIQKKGKSDSSGQ